MNTVVMKNFLLPLLLSLAALSIACGTGQDTTRFSMGPLRNIAITYPHAEQLQEEAGISIPAEMEAMASDLHGVRWKRYRIADVTPRVVSNWYDVLLFGTGWQRLPGQGTNEDITVYSLDPDVRLAVHVEESSNGAELILMEGSLTE